MSSYCLSILNLLWIWQRKSSFAFSNSKREHISIFSLNQIKYDWLSRRPVSAVKGCSLPKTTLTPRCLHGCFSRSHALWFSVNHGQHEHAHQDWSSPILSVFILPMETQNSLLQHPESYLSFFHCLLPSSPCWFSSFLKRSPLLLSWLVFHFSLSSILWSSPPHSRPSISFGSSIYLNLDSTDEVKKQKQVKPHKEFVFLWLVFLA